MGDWEKWDFKTGFDKVLHNFYPEMIEKINTKEMLPHLPSLMNSHTDQEELRCNQKNNGARDTVPQLKECLLRKGYTKEFISALREVGLADMAGRMEKDFEVACGRQPRVPCQGNKPPETLTTTDQGDKTGQGDTNMTFRNCNVQFGDHNEMTVTSPNSSLADGDMSTDSSLSQDISATSCETGSLLSADQPPATPERRLGRLDTSPDDRSRQVDTSPDVRRPPEASPGVAQGHVSLSCQADEPLCASVDSHESGDTSIKAPVEVTLEPSLEPTASFPENLSVEVSTCEDPESYRQLEEDDGGSDDETMLLKLVVETNSSSAVDGSNLPEDAQRGQRDNENQHRGGRPGQCSGQEINQSLELTAAIGVREGDRWKAMPSTNQLVVSGCYSVTHDVTRFHPDSRLVHGNPSVQHRNIQSDICLVNSSDQSDVSLAQDKNGQSEVSLAQDKNGQSEVSLAQDKNGQSDVSLAEGNISQADQDEEKQNRDNILLSIIVAAVAITVVVVFLVKRA